MTKEILVWSNNPMYVWLKKSTNWLMFVFAKYYLKLEAAYKTMNFDGILVRI